MFFWKRTFWKQKLEKFRLIGGALIGSLRRTPRFVKLIAIYLLGVGMALSFFWWNISQYRTTSVPDQSTPAFPKEGMVSIPERETVEKEAETEVTNESAPSEEKIPPGDEQETENKYETTMKEEQMEEEQTEEEQTEEEQTSFSLDWPVSYRNIGTAFNDKIRQPTPQGGVIYSFYDGIDILVSKGTRVKAASEGEVIRVEREDLRLGKSIQIKHDQEIESTYGNLSQVNVNQGDKVSRGDVIGKVEENVSLLTNVDEPHLYFQLRYNETLVDPQEYLTKP